MPTIYLFGIPLTRVRPLLNAIGAQEALEHHRGKEPHTASSRRRAWETERMALARRRNNAERDLRPKEHLAWSQWRDCSPAERAAVFAVLTDLPAGKAAQ